jgi:hypothetical protein
MTHAKEAKRPAGLTALMPNVQSQEGYELSDKIPYLYFLKQKHKVLRSVPYFIVAVKNTL